MGSSPRQPARFPCCGSDLDRLRSQLHPGAGALDFLAAGYQRAGETTLAQSLARQGLARDCTPLDAGPQQDNCQAWYRGIVGMELDQAHKLVEQALATSDHSSEFLDTLSVVLEAQGDLQGARDASWKAATLSPDDIYLLWQASRLDRAVHAGADTPEADGAMLPSQATAP